MSECIKCGNFYLSEPDTDDEMCFRCEMEEKDEMIADLEAKLAEKDLEIERLKQNYDEVWEDTYFSVKEDFEFNHNCNECRRYYAEEFNKQLVEQLEKVKDYFCEEYEDEYGVKTGDWTITIDACKVAEFIDNQIKQLKFYL